MFFNSLFIFHKIKGRASHETNITIKMAIKMMVIKLPAVLVNASLNISHIF